MTKRLTTRLLAFATVVALALLATHAVSHWHGQSSDEDNCQICHVGHASIPQPTPQVAMQAAMPVARLAIADERVPHPDFIHSSGNPRAPPA